MQIDWAALSAAVHRAQAAYVIDPAQSKKAFEALGHTYISLFQDNDSQAVLSLGPNGRTCLSISGTRFSAGKVGDLIDDLQTDLIDLDGGAKVTRGAFESAKEIYDWALSLVPAGTVLDVCGHSLGGWRTIYAVALLPASQIGTLYTFESPKPATAQFYAKYEKELGSLTITAQGKDIWFNYPRLSSLIHRPGPMLWVKPTSFSVIDTAAWPGGFSLADHSVDTLTARIDKFAAAAKPAA